MLASSSNSSEWNNDDKWCSVLRLIVLLRDVLNLLNLADPREAQEECLREFAEDGKGLEKVLDR